MASEHERRLTEYEAQVDQLQEHIKGLEEEVVGLRRRLQDAPKRVRTLEERLLETKGQLAQAVSQNEKLSATLREAREHIAALREEVEKLTMPPSAYGTYLGTNDDGTVDIFTAGRKMRVAVHPELETDELRRGQEVVLNESLNVVLARNSEIAGEIVTFKDSFNTTSCPRFSSPTSISGCSATRILRPAVKMSTVPSSFVPRYVPYAFGGIVSF